jgi:hypothetical protein
MLKCVCKYCASEAIVDQEIIGLDEDKNEVRELNNKQAFVEINFADGCIYFACPNCKKMNKMVLSAPQGKLPRIKRS